MSPRLSPLRHALPLLALLATPAAAELCPPLPDMSAERDRLHADLRVAPDPMTARGLSDALWEIWTTAPDPVSQEMLDSGVERLRLGDHARAIAMFDTLTGYCPHYAEGFNQRAFARFLQGDHAAALPDLDAALEIAPRHVGALSGKALVLMELGRNEAALAALEAALDLHPWLNERALVPVLEDRIAGAHAAP